MKKIFSALTATTILLLFFVLPAFAAEKGQEKADRLSQLEQQVSQLLRDMERIKAEQGVSSDDALLPSPEKALEMLSEGNRRYVAGNSVFPRIDANRRLETAYNGQHPFATIITCSDSRVPVEYIFDQGLGDIFTVRVAGNVCDVDEVGSIEYGVDHLETPVFVVLGHGNCGAVTAVVTEAELHGSIPALVDNIKPAVERAKSLNPHLHGKALVPEAIKANVWQSINDLYTASPAVCQRAKAGTLKVVGAIYDIGTGEVEWLGAHPEEEKLLANTAAAPGHKAEH